MRRGHMERLSPSGGSAMARRFDRLINALPSARIEPGQDRKQHGGDQTIERHRDSGERA